MIQLDVRTEKQEEVIKIIFDLIEELRGKYSKEQIIQETKDKGYPATLITELMTRAMGGDLAKHRDMFISTEKKGMLLKLDSLRCIINAYVDEHADRSNMPESLANYAPGRLFLTAMGLTTIAAGKGGMDLIKSKYLPEIMQGHTMCYGITEPDAGTNTHKVSTTAVEEGDHYIINGQKIFISEADTATFISLVAKVVSKKGGERIGTFIVDMRTEGVKKTPLDIAVFGDIQYSVFFDNVKVSRECLVGVSGSTGGKQETISSSVFQALNLERIGVSLMCLYMGKVVFTKGLKQAKKKRSSGQPMGSYLNIKHKFARVSLKLELANLAIKKAAEEFDNKGEPKIVGLYSNIAKLVSSEAAYEASRIALEVYGVEGLNRKDNIGQLMQMVRLPRLGPINNEMVLNFIGENLLGLPKSYR